MRNPPKRRWTPEYEASIETADRLCCRASIFELGVAEILKRTDGYSYVDTSESAEVLKLAVSLRKQAHDKRIEAESAASKPAKKKGAKA